MERDNPEGFGLSPQQRLSWRLRQDGLRARNVSCLVAVEGPFDPKRMETLLNRVAQQNEILRTRFEVLPAAGLPIQVIEEQADVRLHVEQAGGSARDAAERIRNTFESAEIDPSLPNSLRAAWVADGENAGFLVLCQSDLHGDRKTLELLLEALVVELEAKPEPPVQHQEEGGENEDGDPGPLQYADVSQFLQDALHAEEADDGFAFWRRAAEEEPPEIGLARRSGPTSAATIETVLIDERVSEAARAYATKLGVEPAAVYCAAWQVTLSRHSGRERFMLGVASTGRTYDGLDICMGPLEKLVPLACHVPGGETFETLVREVAEGMEVADERQEHFDFERVFPGRQPGFAVGFEYLPQVDELVTANPEGEEIVLRPTDFRTTGGRVGIQLTCDVSTTPNELRLIHSPDLLSEEAAERILDQLRTLLERARAVDAKSLAEVSSISRDEAALLESFARASDASGPEVNGSIPEWFARRVSETPDATAVIYGEESLSYADLASRARRLARRLIDLGTGPDTIVGIHMGRSIDLVVSIVAVLEAGGAYLPLPPDYPPGRIAFMLSDSKASIVLTREREVDTLTAFDGHVLVLEREADELERLSDEPVAPRLRSDAPAYVIYTSGSSGRPKGVPISHSALAHSTQARLETYNARLSGYLLVSSFAFDSSVAGIFWTLAGGGQLILPEDGFEKDIPSLSKLIRRHEPSHFLALPSLWATLLELGAEDLTSLCTVIVAGESCPRELVARHLDVLPRTELFNEYGPTENTVWSTIHECVQVPARTRVPIGRPIPRVEVRVVDERGHPCPLGVAGELFLGGAGVAAGYLDRRELSADRFVPSPFAADRLYKTGDRVRFLESGELEFLGRLDQQIKLRGHRIELEEIEMVLVEHARVHEVVVGVLGEAERARLVAWFVPTSGSLNPVELKAHLVSRLPHYMIPSEWMELPSLSRLPNGKVDRSNLPDPSASNAEAPYVAPATPLERVVCAVWEDVLDRERIGMRADFFALGGHSILATQLIARLADLLKTRLAVRTLFDTPTPAGINAAFLADPERTRIERTAELLLEVVERDDKDSDDGLEQAS